MQIPHVKLSVGRRICGYGFMAILVSPHKLMTFWIQAFWLGIILLNPSLSFAKDKWQQMKGQNFIINYRGGVPEYFVQTVMDSAEEEFKRVPGNLGISRYPNWMSDNKATIYIYSDETDYVSNGAPGWSHGAAMVGEKVIKTFPSAHGFFDSTLPHELGHIIFREYVGVSADVPLWFEEGMAMYQEKAKRLGVNKAVEEAIKNGQFIPLSKLTNVRLHSNSDENSVQLFYSESASVVYFLITELGEWNFHKLCRELKQNTPFAEALTKTYMRIRSFDDLNKMWMQHLEDHK